MRYNYPSNLCTYFKVYSPSSPSWAFFMIFHVPRLLFDQCFTTLFISVKQSWLIIGSKKTAPKASFRLLRFNVIRHQNPLIFCFDRNSQSVMFSFYCVRFWSCFGHAWLQRFLIGKRSHIGFWGF